MASFFGPQELRPDTLFSALKPLGIQMGYRDCQRISSIIRSWNFW
jgi:hypothetical protein